MQKNKKKLITTIKKTIRNAMAEIEIIQLWNFLVKCIESIFK